MRKRVYDTQHICSWTNWQGNIDAKLMIVGQDWGDDRYFINNQGKESANNPRNRKLVRLLESIGISLMEKNLFVKWFVSFGRDFPWRNESDPFIILITEMLLRQTRASYVARIWQSFIADYSTPNAILNADRTELVKRLSILGFGEQRADALQAASQWLLEHHQGVVPNNLEELLRIPHVGNYAARAVLCFAFGERIEIVDTNILRLFSRYFGVELAPDIRRAPLAWEIAKKLLPREKKKAALHNYGLLDFTAEICKSGKPKCEVCPLFQTCAFWKARVDAKER
jgi:A/G-specific adenine glycosylase